MTDALREVRRCRAVQTTVCQNTEVEAYPALSALDLATSGGRGGAADVENTSGVDGWLLTLSVGNLY